MNFTSLIHSEIKGLECDKFGLRSLCLFPTVRTDIEQSAREIKPEIRTAQPKPTVLNNSRITIGNTTPPVFILRIDKNYQNLGVTDLGLIHTMQFRLQLRDIYQNE